jgi:hypothetical protein
MIPNTWKATLIWSATGSMMENNMEKPGMKNKMILGFILLQRSLLPGGINLQGVLLLQGSMSVFACHYG